METTLISGFYSVKRMKVFDSPCTLVRSRANFVPVWAVQMLVNFNSGLSKNSRSSFFFFFKKRCAILLEFCLDFLRIKFVNPKLTAQILPCKISYKNRGSINCDHSLPQKIILVYINKVLISINPFLISLVKPPVLSCPVSTLSNTTYGSLVGALWWDFAFQPRGPEFIPSSWPSFLLNPIPLSILPSSVNEYQHLLAANLRWISVPFRRSQRFLFV